GVAGEVLEWQHGKGASLWSRPAKQPLPPSAYVHREEQRQHRKHRNHCHHDWASQLDSRPGDSRSNAGALKPLQIDRKLLGGLIPIVRISLGTSRRCLRGSVTAWGRTVPVGGGVCAVYGS